MRDLHLGRGVTWSAEMASSAIGVLGTRGSGKSSFGRVYVEELFASKIPFVVFDPIGNWHGIRAGVDGSPGGGLPIPIFGGQHADLPLDRTSGAKIADLIVDRGLSCVLDLSHEDFSEADKQRFLAEFGDRLFRRKHAPGWLTLVMEEADDYAPQPRSGGGVKGPAAATLGMFQKIVRRGRFKGLGDLMITQRSAAINKDLLYMVGTLVVFRTTGPRDQDAVAGWVKYNAIGDELLASLATLEDGEAWVISPEALGKIERVRFRRMATYDTGATPEHGRQAKTATLVDIDVPALSKELAAAAEKAKAEDPRELKRQLAETRQAYLNLAADLAPGGGPKEALAALHQLKAQAAKPPAAAKPPKPPKPALTDAQVQRVERAIATLEAMEERFRVACEADLHQLRDLGDQLAQKQQVVVAEAGNLRAQLKATLEGHVAFLGAEAAGKPAVLRWERGIERQAAPARPAAAETEDLEDDGPVDAARGRNMRRAFLTVLAQHPEGRSKKQVLILASYRSSGNTAQVFAALLRDGAVEAPEPGQLRITPAGLAELGAYTPLPKGRALRDQLLRRARPMESAVLRVIFTAWPSRVKKGDVLEAAGYRSSGNTAQVFGKILAVNLATSPAKGYVRAADELFEEPGQ